MVTFCQISAKKLAFLQFLQKQAVVWAKNANIFAYFFGQNI
jgi:hypothetical protein